MKSSPDRDLAEWQKHRGPLLGLAYRMLGDAARAEDVVQEAWLRWKRAPRRRRRRTRSYLFAVVTRLCLNELGSARARREESRGDRLPEPVDLSSGCAEGDRGRRAGVDWR